MASPSRSEPSSTGSTNFRARTLALALMLRLTTYFP